MSLSEIFDSAKSLPSMPKLIQELIASFEDEDLSVDEFSSKISMDPALTAKLLRIANSAHYKRSRNIGSVEDAVVVIGFNGVRTLILATGVTSAFDYPKSFDKRAFWQNSFETAEICRWLAKCSSADAEVAFTCGMLSDIGTILLVSSREEMVDILQAAMNGADRDMLEHEAFGFSAADVSAGLANHWRFPDDLVQALASQSQQSEQSLNQFAMILSIAKQIQYTRRDLSLQALTQSIPLDLARDAGINLSKALAEIDLVYSLEFDVDMML